MIKHRFVPIKDIRIIVFNYQLITELKETAFSFEDTYLKKKKQCKSKLMTQKKSNIKRFEKIKISSIFYFTYCQ